MRRFGGKTSQRWVVVALALALVLVTGVVSGCGRPKKITISGSTALAPLLKQASSDYQGVNSRVTVEVSGGGSFTGLTQVASGAVNIGASDVPAPPDLASQGLVDHKVAVAPFLLVVNPGVSVSNLTAQQAVDIFTGKVTNWKQVGGQDLPIVIIHRAASSGSRATIKQVVLNGQEFTDKATILNSNGEVRKAIGQTPGAIGYIDAAYLDNTVKALSYNGVAYSPQAVIGGQYPIFAYEHLFTKGTPPKNVQAFLDFVMSPDFQNKWVEQLGFIPMSKMPPR